MLFAGFAIQLLVLLLSNVDAQGTVTISTVSTGTSTPTSTPTLTGRAIAFDSSASPAGSSFVDVFLSSDLQETIQATLDNACQVDKTECAQYLNAALLDAQVSPGSNLQGRQFGETIIIASIAIPIFAQLVYLFLNKKPDTKLEVHYNLDSGQTLDSPLPSAVVIAADNLQATIPTDPSLTTSTSVPEPYVIVPNFAPSVKNTVDEIVLRQFERVAFEGRAAEAKIILDRVLSDNYINLWKADLLPLQVAFVKSDPAIAAVLPNGPVEVIENEQISAMPRRIRRTRRDHLYRDLTNEGLLDKNSTSWNATIKLTTLPGWTTQQNAGIDLHVLSSKATNLLADADYDYISSAGGQSIVYVVEVWPFRISHPEIGLSLPRDRDRVDGWIAPNTQGSRRSSQLFPNTLSSIFRNSGHGTQVLSKLIGPNVGAAKSARVVCVQVPLHTWSTMDGFLASWRDIVGDAVAMKAQNPDKNVIINMSLSHLISRASYRQWAALLRAELRSPLEAGIPLILAAGNALDKANYASSMQETATLNPDLKIIMAGHTHKYGTPVLQGDPHANVWAVAKDIPVAEPFSDTTTWNTGSSLAAPLVSGLLATMLEDPRLQSAWSAAGSTSKAALDLLQSKSALRTRRDGTSASLAKPLVYNLAHEPNCALARRSDEQSECVSQPPASSTPSPSPSSSTSSDLPVITSGSNGGSCGGQERVGPVGINSKPINKDALQECLLNLDTSKWLDAGVGAAFDCQGMVSFQSASNSWDSPPDCHNACKNCLSQSIANGINQIWCDAWSGSAHCWEGYIITPPPLVTDGTPYDPDPHGDGNGNPQHIVATGYTGIDGKYIDEYAVQDCIRHMDASQWIPADPGYVCGGMLRFSLSSTSLIAWSSPSDCWNAVKNCLSDAVNKGASEAYCGASSGFVGCRGGSVPR